MMELAVLLFFVITLLVSGVMTGIFRTLHKVLGYSNRYVGGNPEGYTDIGIVPLLILKTGVGSLFGVVIASEISAFREPSTIITLSIVFGGGLACIHSAIVWFLASARRFNCGLVGAGIGLFIGGIIGGIIGGLGAQIFHSEIVAILLFILVLAGGIILGSVLGVKYEQSSSGRLAAEVAATMVLCGCVGGLVGLFGFNAEFGAAVIGMFFGAFLGEILGGVFVILLTMLAIFSLFVFIGLSHLLILARFKTILCGNCLCYTQPLKSRYNAGLRYCEHCHTEVELTREPGKVIFLFGQFSESQLQELRSSGKRNFIVLNPTFGETRQKPENGLFFRSAVDLNREECPVDASEVYIDTKTSEWRLLERFITYIVNYQPRHGLQSIKLFYWGEINDFGENLRNALRNNFGHLKQL